MRVLPSKHRSRSGASLTRAGSNRGEQDSEGGLEPTSPQPIRRFRLDRSGAYAVTSTAVSLSRSARRPLAGKAYLSLTAELSQLSQPLVYIANPEGLHGQKCTSRRNAERLVRQGRAALLGDGTLYIATELPGRPEPDDGTARHWKQRRSGYVNVLQLVPGVGR